MEALYLLCSIFTNAVTSAFLSVSLLLRSLLPSRFSSSSSSSSSECVRLYEGRVKHVRARPVSHEFEYQVKYALLDLDRAPPPDVHLTADRARKIAETNGPVFLLTIPKSVGYEQNPLSIYYCYDLIQDNKSSLKTCIAEVTNTPWGERVNFVFQPGSDFVAKPLHVSPFMDMMGNWRIETNEPGENLSVIISVHHETLGNYFTAILRAKQVDSVKDSISVQSYFWLMPHKVAFWIYWQAVRLWIKNVKFLDHPKYFKPNYRDEALERDKKLSCGGQNGKQRYCVWTDAKWPWS
ncbi:hypothetical protein LUZ60_010300 [Juncus effusus]|nr:hypothetical protein LUZ60_010300 [Juncus effusus]